MLSAVTSDVTLLAFALVGLCLTAIAIARDLRRAPKLALRP